MAGPDPFAHPEGAAGALAGLDMARENGRSERWVAAQVPSSAMVLEVGCGPGVGLAALGRRGVGIDLSAAMVRQARRRAPGSAVVRGDAAHLPFAAGAFGAAMAVHCLALLPRGALREIRRVLRVGAPFLAVHRPERQGGPPPGALTLPLEAAGFCDVAYDEPAGCTLVRGRA